MLASSGDKIPQLAQNQYNLFKTTPKLEYFSTEDVDFTRYRSKNICSILYPFLYHIHNSDLASLQANNL